MALGIEFTTASRRKPSSCFCWAETNHLKKRTFCRRGCIGRTIKGEAAMTKKITTYQEDLIEALKDPREAAAYLNAAMEEGDRALFLLALRNVAEAQGGMAAVSQKSKLNQIGRASCRERV